MLKFETSLTVCAVAMYLFVGGAGMAPAADPLGSGFSFQGQLKQGGAPLNDTADFEFTLYDADVDGNQIGGVVAIDNVTVVDGLFTVVVNAGGEFGADAMNGEARFLEVAVRSPAGGGDFTPLDPRQALRGTPYALKVPGVDGHSLDAADGDPVDALFVENNGDVTISSDLTVANANPVLTIEDTDTNSWAMRVSGKNLLFEEEEFGLAMTLEQGSGNVGIGASNPSAKLDVVGTTELNGDVTITSNLTVNTDTLFVDGTSGAVGIGTLTPTEVLEVVGNVSADRFLGDGSGLSGVLGLTVDLDNVALLRWDLLNRSFSVGSDPRSLAFDGANIWVANYGGNNVKKLRASDGTILGSFPVGDRPSNLTFDGANIWVTNLSDRNVTKLRASDGTNLGTFPVESIPRGSAFDGANIWVVNASHDSVSKLRASDGVEQPGSPFAVGDNPWDVAFDGTSVWVANFLDDTVTKLLATDGTNLGTFPVGSRPTGVAFDGENVWVVNRFGNTLTKLQASDGVEQPGSPFTVGNFPSDVAFDGVHIWVTNSGDNSVTKLRASDGTNLGTFNVGDNPRGVAFDGANLWVANGDDNTVTRISLVK